MLEQLPPLTPAAFFTFSCKILHSEKGLPAQKKDLKPYLMPSFSFLFSEEEFAKGAVAWSEGGLYFDFLVESKMQESFFPNFRDGDALELFIDTRDLKSAGSATRFCHHFVFLPKETDGIRCQEVTRFRTDDTHVLCDADQLEFHVDPSKTGYKMSIHIPSACLHGYDPLVFDRIGFSYLISRYDDQPQSFVVSSQEYTIEQNPSLWASCLLVSKEKEKK